MAVMAVMVVMVVVGKVARARRNVIDRKKEGVMKPSESN